jgi:hypothetical protein
MGRRADVAMSAALVASVAKIDLYGLDPRLCQCLISPQYGHAFSLLSRSNPEASQETL